MRVTSRFCRVLAGSARPSAAARGERTAWGAWAARLVLGGALGVLGALFSGCSQGRDTFMLLPMPVELHNNLLTVIGDMQPTLGPRCGAQPDDNAPPGAGVQRLLIDTATPLSAFVPAVMQPALPFRHGEVALYASRKDGTAGPLRLLLCDTPLVRTDQELNEFRLDRSPQTTGPLGGVIGGDLLGRFALNLRFAGSGATTSANLTFSRSDNSPSCQLDDAVFPYRPLGGQLAVQVSDAVITYPATRITIAACVEPLADPLRPDSLVPCLPDDAVESARASLTMQREVAKSKTPVDQAAVDRLQRSLDALAQATDPQCTTVADPIELSDVIETLQLRQPAFSSSGVDMQFLVSTALPDLIISETACRRLDDPARCTCDANKVTLRLPGLNQSDAQAEQGCPITLGGRARTALALVARQRYLSACGELARSRRQRYALPRLGTRTDLDSPCRHEACLVNLQRDPGMTARRCGYSGPDPQLACDDHTSPVAAVVELGGASSAITTAAPDLLPVLVVPDTARILQSANADIRSDGPQVDGVIGVAILARLATTVDYPQTRVAISCRCDDTPGNVCRAYRGVTYNPADSCSQDSFIQIPADYSRVICR